jgi:amidohydrolase
MNIKSRIDTIWPQLHALAEPAFKEVKTAAFLAAALRKAGYAVTEGVGGTGVVGILDSGKPGPVAALRSDMDCLIFKEADGTTKAIHACGHDAHMTMVLVAAERLAAEKISRGKVKIIFQPAEEIGQGALAMVKAGALDDVDFLFGQHVMPLTMAKSGQVIPSIKWTACTLIKAVLTGKAAHASQPHLGVSALDAGVAIVDGVNALHTDPLLGGSVKATKFQAGSTLNIIPEKAELGFDLRSTSNKEMLSLRQKVTAIITSIAKAFGVEAKVTIEGTCPASSEDDTLLSLVQSVIKDEVGEAGLLPQAVTTVGEDFNFYPMEMPKLKTAFLGLGCNLVPGLHDPKMHFNHDDMVHGCNIMYGLIKKALLLK